MSNPRVSPKVRLTNRIVALYGALGSVVGAWIVPLIDPALKHEIELRNRLFCLMIYGFAEAG